VVQYLGKHFSPTSWRYYNAYGDQVLEYGFKSGGVYVGLWWWIIPPGLLIIWTAITFVLIALEMEPVVNPRLRRMK
jgi:peptide/nickel transport system permease protein